MPVSHSEFLAMQERCARGQRKSTPPITGGESKESNLHAMILQECALRNWIALHGSMAHRAMRTVGEPDFTILANHGRVFFVECKSKTGKLSPEQLALRVWAETLGHKIHEVRSFEQFKALVRDNVSDQRPGDRDAKKNKSSGIAGFAASDG